jgi:hypothetical protein
MIKFLVLFALLFAGVMALAHAVIDTVLIHQSTANARIERALDSF